MERLSGLDAGFLYGETPTLHMHTLKLAVLDPSFFGGASVEALREELAKRLHLLPPFRRRMVEVPGHISHPVWIEDPEFDIGQHIRHAPVPSPGTRAQMDEVVGRLASQPLDRSRPLWELWLLDGLEDGNVAILAKIHHAVADGMAALAMMANALSIIPAEPEEPESEWEPEPFPSKWRLFWSALLDRLRDIARLPELVIRTTRRLRRRRRWKKETAASPPRPLVRTPPTSFNGSLTTNRCFASCTLSLTAAKAIKRAFGATVTDVILACVAGSLREYLLANDELPNRPLVASVPVSSGDDADRLTGNKVSNLFTEVPVQLHDPLARLRACHEVTLVAKEALNVLGVELMEEWVQYAPPRPYAWWVRTYSERRWADRHRPPVNLVVSSVPGPRGKLYIGDAELREIYSVGPLVEGVGLNVTVWSYGEDLNVGVLSCPEFIPELHVITGGMLEAMAELSTLAEGATAAAVE